MSYQTGKINIFIIFANIVWGRREERKEEAFGGVVFVRGAGRGNDNEEDGTTYKTRHHFERVQ